VPAIACQRALLHSGQPSLLLPFTPAFSASHGSRAGRKMFGRRPRDFFKRPDPRSGRRPHGSFYLPFCLNFPEYRWRTRCCARAPTTFAARSELKSASRIISRVSTTRSFKNRLGNLYLVCFSETRSGARAKDCANSNDFPCARPTNQARRKNAGTVLVTMGFGPDLPRNLRVTTATPSQPVAVPSERERATRPHTTPSNHPHPWQVALPAGTLHQALVATAPFVHRTYRSGRRGPNRTTGGRRRRPRFP